jgi:uncharacterized protein
MIKSANVIEQTADFVQAKLAGEASGHDWWHVYRVWKNAQQIGLAEGADMLTVELAALLHDIADWKFNGGDMTAGPTAARTWLESLAVDAQTVDKVCEIIATVSYKGAGVDDKMSSLEGQVVQDADRLDAIGAIGVARTFAYGGHFNRVMYDPEMKPELHSTFEAYKDSNTHTINHFYEKLLLVKDRLKTVTARKLAQARHEFMEKFLQQFFLEWQAEGLASGAKEISE